jgi:hypothetical protein
MEAALYQQKARFEERGYPCPLTLDYSLVRGRYISADYDGRGERRLIRKMLL